MEVDPAAEFVGEIVVLRENDGLAGVHRQAGGHQAKPGETGRKPTQGVGLGGDKGLGWGQEIGTVDQDGRVHGISRAPDSAFPGSFCGCSQNFMSLHCEGVMAVTQQRSSG
jgi:hypothetical protein